MRFGTAVGVKAATLWLPDERESAAEEARRRPSAFDPARLGVSELPVSTRYAAPELAVLAAAEALKRADWPAERLGYLVHGWLYHQGHDFWSPAHYIAARLGAHEALPFGVQQMSNGGALALELCATRLLAVPELRSALATTADRFSPPGFDRWAGDYDVAYGDAGAAVLLGRSGPADVLQLLSMSSLAVPELEVMFRGDDGFSSAPLEHAAPIDIRRPKKAFLAAGGMSGLSALGPAKVHAVLTTALAEAGIDPHDERIRCIALPRLGPRTLDEMYLPVIRSTVKAEPVHLGAGTGHLGAGDFLANLADVVGAGLLQPGEIAVVIGGGGGFTLSCVVVSAPERRS